MHRAKGDRFVRASELPVCENADACATKGCMLGWGEENTSYRGFDRE